MALIANVNRAKKQKPLQPRDFNPLEKSKPRKMTKAKFAEALATFVSPERLEELRQKGVLGGYG